MIRSPEGRPPESNGEETRRRAGRHKREGHFEGRGFVELMGRSGVSAAWRNPESNVAREQPNRRRMDKSS